MSERATQFDGSVEDRIVLAIGDSTDGGRWWTVVEWVSMSPSAWAVGAWQYRQSKITTCHMKIASIWAGPFWKPCLRP